MKNQILIVDYSWSGTTTKLADQLQKIIPADQLRITVPVGTFTNDMYATSDIAKRQLAADQLSKLTNTLPDFNQYRMILVGGPVWGGQVSTPVRTLLAQMSNFEGTIAPFYTDAGTPGSYEQDFQQLVPHHNVAQGLGLTAGELNQSTTLSQWWQTISSK